MAFTGIVTGSVSNELISSGVQNIYSGGVAGSCAIIDGGWQYLFSGGIASYTEIDSSGRQIVSSGGTAYYTLINYNGNQLVDGAASPLTSANAALTYDPLKKSPGMLAS